MSKDYYAILGIEKNANKEDVKKAFHKLARKYHPDNKTSGDEQKFKEVNEAYQTLSDERKRSEYDTYGHVFSGAGGAHGASGFNPFGGDGGFGFSGGQGVEFDFGDIFNEFFSGGGGGKSRRGKDISIDLEIPFAESVFGTHRTILLTKASACASCAGSGAQKGAGFIKCATCNGQGRLRESRNAFFGTFTSMRECNVCKGEGKTPKEKCSLCHGAGIVRKQEEVTITIPPGIENGEVIRLGGLGEAVPGGATGDLYARIRVGVHQTFKREGNNLVMVLHVKLSDALLGNEYKIKLLDDSTITLKVPAGTSIGEVLRVRGKGIPIDRNRHGDLLVKLDVQLPKNLSLKAKKLIEDLKNEGI